MRKHRTNNNATGLTTFDNFIPTMTIAATKDGLYRCTRAGEGYWHGFDNIDTKEKGNFPVVIVKGGSHGSFMDEDILPSKVMAKDLKPEITQDEAHRNIAKKIVNFIKYVNGEG